MTSPCRHWRVPRCRLNIALLHSVQRGHNHQPYCIAEEDDTTDSHGLAETPRKDGTDSQTTSNAEQNRPGL